MTIKAGVDFTKTIRDGIFKFFSHESLCLCKTTSCFTVSKEKNTKHNKYFLQMLCKNNVFGDAIVL